MSQGVTQAVVTAQATINPGQGVESLALFNPDGSVWTGATVPDATTVVKGKVLKGAAVTAIATANGTDAGTTQTLANDTKAKVNALIASLTTAGII